MLWTEHFRLHKKDQLRRRRELLWIMHVKVDAEDPTEAD